MDAADSPSPQFPIVSLFRAWGRSDTSESDMVRNGPVLPSMYRCDFPFYKKDDGRDILALNSIEAWCYGTPSGVIRWEHRFERAAKARRD